METNPTPSPTFKLLKITNAHGVVNYIPDNRMNRNHHETFQRSLSKEKREKYKIEPVELSTQEASDLGVAEAYYILHPHAKKQQVNAANSDIMKMLVEQNAKLMEMLEAKNETTKPKK